MGLSSSIAINLLADAVFQSIQTSETIRILSDRLGEAESEEERKEILDDIQDQDIRRAAYVAYQHGYQEGIEEINQKSAEVEPRPEIDQEIEGFIDRRLETPIEDGSRQEIAAKIRSIFENHEDVTVAEIQKAFENNLEDKINEITDEQSKLRKELNGMERSRRIWQGVSIVLGLVSVGLALPISLPF